MGEYFARMRPTRALDWTGERLTSAATGQVETEHFHRFFLARHLARGLDVLDIASGEGLGSAFLAQSARSVIGVEIDNDAVEHAKHSYTARNLRFVRGSAQAIPLRDNSVDCVVSFETIEHFYDQEQFLIEIRRVLRPEGKLIISAPNRDIYTPPGWPSNPFHVRELTRTEFEKALSIHFENIVYYGQRSIIGSVIVRETDADSPFEAFSFSHLETDRFEASAGLDRPMYCLAIASNIPFQSLSASFYFEPGSVDDIMVTLPALRSQHRDACARTEILEAEVGNTRTRSEILEAEIRNAHARAEIMEADAREAHARCEILEAEIRNAHTRAEALEIEVTEARVRAETMEAEAREARVRAEFLEADLKSFSAKALEWDPPTINWNSYNASYYIWKEYRKKHINRNEALRKIHSRLGIHTFFFLYPVYKIIKPFIKCLRFLYDKIKHKDSDKSVDQRRNDQSHNDNIRGSISLVQHESQTAGEDFSTIRPRVVKTYIKESDTPSTNIPKVLVIGVYLSNRQNNVDDIIDAFSDSRFYDVSQRWIALQGPASKGARHVTMRDNVPPAPKYVLLNSLLESEDLEQFEYVITADDDIVLPRGFVDEFLFIQKKLQFCVAQPARTPNSHVDHPIVRQELDHAARQTRFVEIGPVVSFHQSAYGIVFPFDVTSPMGWGYEQVWSYEILKHEMKMGIIDNTPVDHSMRPPAAYYDMEKERERWGAFLKQHGHFTLDECYRVLRVYDHSEIL